MITTSNTAGTPHSTPRESYRHQINHHTRQSKNFNTDKNSLVNHVNSTPEADLNTGVVIRSVFTSNHGKINPRGRFKSNTLNPTLIHPVSTAFNTTGDALCNPSSFHKCPTIFNPPRPPFQTTNAQFTSPAVLITKSTFGQTGETIALARNSS